MQLTTLTLKVKLTESYQNNDFEIHESFLEIVIPLYENQLQVSTDPVVIGLSKSNEYFEANLVIKYRYEPELNLITFYGNDLVSPDSIRLILRPVNGGEAIAINSYEPQSSDLLEELRMRLRSVNDQIIKHAEDCNLNVIVRTPMPELASELHEDLKIVHYKGRMLELFNSEKEYDSDHEVLHYRSTHYGTGKLAPGQKFANVLGSTADPRINSISWLMLWRNEFGPVENCTSHNYDGFNCTTRLVGGHCILGSTSKAVEHGSNYVFIAPICIQHNNNNNVHMMPLMNDGRVITLKGYMM